MTDYIKEFTKLLQNIDYSKRPATVFQDFLTVSTISFANIVYKSDGTPNLDKETKDIELIKVSDDVDKYFEREVYPHVPDAKYLFEEDLTKKDKPVIKTGAEFPFTRYFYQYQPPKKSAALLQKFFDIENSLNETLRELKNV